MVINILNNSLKELKNSQKQPNVLILDTANGGWRVFADLCFFMSD